MASGDDKTLGEVVTAAAGAAVDRACASCGNPSGCSPLCDACRRGRQRGYGAASRRRQSIRDRQQRAFTVGAKPLSRDERRAAERLVYPFAERPLTRGDCLEGGSNGERPCPWVSCRYHLFLDVSQTGGLKFNFPGLEVEDLRDTCALDIADRQGMTLDEIGELLNITHERVRQVEVKALVRLHRSATILDGGGDK